MSVARTRWRIGAASRGSPRTLLRDQRGLVFVEYVIALVLLGVGACLAICTCAVLLVRLFAFQQAVLLMPFP